MELPLNPPLPAMERSTKEHYQTIRGNVFPVPSTLQLMGQQVPMASSHIDKAEHARDGAGQKTSATATGKMGREQQEVTENESILFRMAPNQNKLPEKRKTTKNAWVDFTLNSFDFTGIPQTKRGPYLCSR